MTRLLQSASLAIVLSAVCLLSGGCNTSMTSSDLRDDWTPELLALTESDEQYRNATSRHQHNTWRQVYDDWASLWLERRNMKLTRYPLP